MKRLYALDAVKFLFSIIIVFFHLFYSNMKPYIGGTELFQLAAIAMQSSGAIVECFLIIAGYFIYTGFKKANKSFATYVSDRLIRLWPVFAFYCLCCVFLVNCNFQDLFLDLCFLRCTGISLAYRGIIWYIPPFFWCSLLIYAILKAFSRQKAILLLAVLMYICYAVNINHLNGGLGRETIHKWLSLGMLRVMGGLCAGVLVAVIKEMWFQQDILSPKLKYVCISLIEALSLGTLTWHFLIEKLYNNTIISVIIFSILFLCLLSNSGLISRILSWSPWHIVEDSATASMLCNKSASGYWLDYTGSPTPNPSNNTLHSALLFRVSVAFSLASQPIILLKPQPSNSGTDSRKPEHEAELHAKDFPLACNSAMFN